ncbi:hypothetical protein BBP40_000735 [Aspergillus hancockii]|nr:hypothetical protein BBP40_000735 [Aspergillus hancockii]
MDVSSARLGTLILTFFAVASWATSPLIPLHLMMTALGGYSVNQILMMSSRSGQLGNIIGPTATVAVVQRVFRVKLERNLKGREEKKLIGQIINDDRFAQRLAPAAQNLVRWSYLNAFSTGAIDLCHVLFGHAAYCAMVEREKSRMASLPMCSIVHVPI